MISHKIIIKKKTGTRKVYKRLKNQFLSKTTPIARSWSTLQDAIAEEFQILCYKSFAETKWQNFSRRTLIWWQNYLDEKCENIFFFFSVCGVNSESFFSFSFGCVWGGGEFSIKFCLIFWTSAISRSKKKDYQDIHSIQLLKYAATPPFCERENAKTI